MTIFNIKDYSKNNDHIGLCSKEDGLIEIWGNSERGGHRKTLAIVNIKELELLFRENEIETL
jgi:hypothetical protein